jgi:hypothetical protein
MSGVPAVPACLTGLSLAGPWSTASAQGRGLGVFPVTPKRPP